MNRVFLWCCQFGILCRTATMLVLVLACVSAADALEIWTDASGKRTIEADFLQVSDGVLHVRTAEGKRKRIRLELLDEASRELALKLQSEKDADEPEKMPAKKTEKEPAKKSVEKSTERLNSKADLFASVKNPIETLNAMLEEGVSKNDNFVMKIWQAFGTETMVTTYQDAYAKRLKLLPKQPGKIKFMTWQNYRIANGIKRGGYRPSENKSQVADVDQWVSEIKAALDYLEQASKSPKYFSPMVFNENGDADPIWIPAALFSADLTDGLLARSDLRLREGDLEGAWDSIVASFRISRLVSREPSITGLITATAIDERTHKALLDLSRHEKFNKELADRCLREFRALEPMPMWADKLEQGEKAIVLHRVRFIESGGPKALIQTLKSHSSYYTAMSLPRRVEDLSTQWSKHVAGQWKQAKPLITNRYDEIAAMLRENPRSQFARAKRSWDKSNLSPIGKLGIWDEKEMNLTQSVTAEDLVKFILLYTQPDMKKFDKYEAPMLDRQQYAPVVLALGAYHATRGEYPEKLAELAPDYLAETPMNRVNLDESNAPTPLYYRKMKSGGYLLKSSAKTRKGGISVK